MIVGLVINTSGVISVLVLGEQLNKNIIFLCVAWPLEGGF